MICPLVLVLIHVLFKARDPLSLLKININLGTISKIRNSVILLIGYLKTHAKLYLYVFRGPYKKVIFLKDHLKIL